MIDPFAGSVENNVPETTEVDPPVAVTREALANGELVTTIKYGTGYDAPWDVLHTDSVESTDAILSSPAFVAHVERVYNIWRFTRKKTAALLAEDEGGATPAARPAASQGGSQGQGRGNPPGVPAINCEHGTRNYVAKANWAALFCAAPQEEANKCEPLWRDKFGNYKAK